MPLRNAAPPSWLPRKPSLAPTTFSIRDWPPCSPLSSGRTPPSWPSCAAHSRSPPTAGICGSGATDAGWRATSGVTALRTALADPTIDITEDALRATARKVSAARPGVEPGQALAVIQVLLVLGWRPAPDGEVA